MSTIANKLPEKRRVFIAASNSDTEEIQKALHQYGLVAVTINKDAVAGSTWVASLHKCVQESDMVVGIMGDRKRDTNVFFELGVASALNKPALLLIPQDYPPELIPPSGIPYLRTDLRNQNSIKFSLEQMLSIHPREGPFKVAESSQSRPIGALADQLLEKLPKVDSHELEDLVYEAVKASGVSSISRGRGTEDKEIDLAVWSNDLEPIVANPLIIECKLNLRNQSDVNEVIGRIFKALDMIQYGFGLVIYREANPLVTKATPGLCQQASYPQRTSLTVFATQALRRSSVSFAMRPFILTESNRWPHMI
jgi:nucleoside 2-deoxyribosyltransferase